MSSGKLANDRESFEDAAAPRDSSFWKLAAIGGFAFGLICLGISVGVIWNRNSTPPIQLVSTTPVSFAPDSASRAKGMSMATGLISEDVEGLFVLDHENGDLIGTVINPSTGKVGAAYKTNVFADMGITNQAASEFVMTTGQIRIRGQRGNQEPAYCVVYVGDAATGKVAGYSCFYSRAIANKGKAQSGPFKLVFANQTRSNVVRRDQ